MNAEKIISIKNLKMYYPSSKSDFFKKKTYVKAVNGVEFDIFKGETFGLVGESGCGKSTTGYMLSKLLDPTEGSINFNGKDITKASKAETKNLRKNVQIIFQDPFASLNPKKKIGWLLEEPLNIHKIGDANYRKKAVNDMLKIVGLEESYKKAYPHELSGGQRQRISIAIALILKPSFVIADEAVSALDVSIQAQILNLMKKLQRELKLTYLFISHDLNVIQYMSDRVGVMYLGKLVEIGSAEDIYDNPLHPYTKALFSAIPSIEENNKERIILKGDVPNSAALPSGCPFHTRCFNAKPICKSEVPEFKEVHSGRKVSCHFVK